MEIPINAHKRFVGVEYPGVIQNIDSALETLGGVQNISKTLSDQTRRLELRFRPKDPYSKPTCGDRARVTNMVLKVRRRKIRSVSQGRSSSSADEEYEYKAEVLGFMDTTFNFQSLADFQYIPMEKTSNSQSYSSLLDKLVLDSIQPSSWLQQPAPLFLPPPIFSRIDNPVDYSYRDAPKSRTETFDKSKGFSNNLIGVSRQRRPHYTLFMNFDDKVAPTEPIKEAVDKMHAKVKDEEKINELKKMFEERPIWSKNALKAKLSLTPEYFKLCLPALAFYMVTGPWRSLWVRLGYDPRKDPKAKIYQLIDYRIRQKTAAEKLKINPKRSTFQYQLPNTVNKTNARVSTLQHEILKTDWSEASKNSVELSKESTYVFRPGLVPAYRQMFYQLCDIEEPSIQRMMEKPLATTCDERNGWFTFDIQSEARNVIASYVNQVIKKSDDSDILNTLTEGHPSTSTHGSSAVEAGGDGDAGEDVEMGDETLEEEENNEMEMELMDYLTSVDISMDDVTNP